MTHDNIFMKSINKVHIRFKFYASDKNVLTWASLFVNLQLDESVQIVFYESIVQEYRLLNQCTNASNL